MTPEIYDKSFATLNKSVYDSFLKGIVQGKITCKELIIY